MKPKFLLCFALLALTSVVFISCKKDEPLIDPEAELNAEVVLWMYDAMEKVYFWNYMSLHIVQLRLNWIRKLFSIASFIGMKIAGHG